ncbi:glycosyltransferase family 25 protein [Paludisphaera rhizosphaerae]|uniref:LPS biosynthesis glycosyltransferase n=1 Tax=Paludisphaera rhizosphaerae TaxID=2711216 RepID=UPI0013EC2FD8|nr:LPS biosynthesis glycosyltransferase [Paludisphaera rhizosphaerae]
MPILDCFSRAYVINLPQRGDRRKETRAMFERVGLEGWRDRVEFFPAVKPDSPGGFPNIGSRGCFLSHLGILKRVQAEGAGDVLIMEDDLEIADDFVRQGDVIREILRREPWGFAYFGHQLESFEDGAEEPLRPFTGPIRTTHFLAIRGDVVPRVVDCLEAILQRPPGSPDGGPMHVDGAYSWFRNLNPDVLTLVAAPNLGFQRSSASDITTAWFDRIPGLRSAAEAGRWVKRRVRR